MVLVRTCRVHKRLSCTRTVPVAWVRRYPILVLQVLIGDVPLDPVSARQRKQRVVGDTCGK